MKIMRRAFPFLLILLLLSSLSPAAFADNPVQEARSSVVRIASGYFLDDEPILETVKTGTGICLGPKDGKVTAIATNGHVVLPELSEEEYQLAIRMAREETGGTFSYRVYVLTDNKARLVDYDRDVTVSDRADLALIRLDEPLRGRKPAALCDMQDVDVTDTVYAIGYPGLADVADYNIFAASGLEATFTHYAPSRIEDLSVTQGNISRTHVMIGGVEYIQHEANITHGNSGGPLVDENGRVVGVNTQMYVDQDSAAKVQMAIDGKELTKFLDRSHADYFIGQAEAGRRPVIYYVLGGAAVLALLIWLSGRRPKAVPAAVPAAAPESPVSPTIPTSPSAPTIPPEKIQTPETIDSIEPVSVPVEPTISYHMGKKPAAPAPAAAPKAPRPTDSDIFEAPADFDDVSSAAPSPAPKAAPAEEKSGFTIKTSFK